MQELVILDMDGVIINGQSQKVLLNFLFKKRIIKSFFYFKIYFWFILYKLNLINNPKKIMNFAFSFLKGKKEEEVNKIIAKFFDVELKRFIFPEIIDIINEHKLKSRKIIIISNATDLIVKKIANYFNIKDFIGTQLEVVNGVFSGKILGEIVYGKQKLIMLNNFLKETNLNTKNSFVYTDHISDLPLLLASMNPIVVNPERRLLKQAKKNNWKIYNFKK
jgi:HAD superfamily hydrolase (TIGR01490 family)